MFLLSVMQAFGPRLFNGDVVTMLADIQKQTLAVAVNGVCHGALPFSANRISLAAALAMQDTISLQDGLTSHGVRS